MWHKCSTLLPNDYVSAEALNFFLPLANNQIAQKFQHNTEITENKNCSHATHIMPILK